MQEHTELYLMEPKLIGIWMNSGMGKREKIAPITIDMALTRACNYACYFCYAMLQENDRKVINKKVIFDFLEDH